MDKRVLLAVVLSLLVLYLFDAYFAPPKKQQPPKKAGETIETPMPEKKVGEVLEEKKMDSYPSAPHGVVYARKRSQGRNSSVFGGVFFSWCYVKTLVFKKIF